MGWLTSAVFMMAVMDKVGTFGMLRYCLPLFPDAATFFRPAIITLAVIGIIIAVAGAADYFVQFILVIGTIIAPYGGVYLASFFTGRKTARWAHGATVPLVDGWSIAAWVVGIFVAVATTNPADGPGFGWFTLTSISALDGLLVGFVAYLALLPLRRRVTPASAPVTDEVTA